MPSKFTHVVRPLWNILEDISTGLSSGFLNVDLDQPFFCFTDGISTAASALDLYLLWQDTNSNDVYANLYDVLIPLQYFCNPLSWAGLFSFPMFILSDPLKNWITESRNQLLYLPIFVLFALQWYSDITLAYDTWSFRFAEHWDLKNGTYILGKILSSGLLFLSFIEFVTDAQATPRTADIPSIRDIFERF